MYRFRIVDIKTNIAKEAWLGVPKLVDNPETGNLTFSLPIATEEKNILVAENASQAFFMYTASKYALNDLGIDIAVEPYVVK